MRETDDACVGRGRIYVDTMAALEESGDLAGPLARGVIRRDAIAGTLDDLCSRDLGARRTGDEPPIFYAVGPALAHLCAVAPPHPAALTPDGARPYEPLKRAATPGSGRPA